MKYLYSIMIAFLVVTNYSYAQWAKIASGTTSDLSGVYFLNADTGFVTGGGYSSPIVILKTTDGGDTWIKKFSAMYSDTSVQSLEAITFTGNDTGFIVGVGANVPLIMITTDGGDTWNKYTGTVPAQGDFNSIQFYDKKNGFVTGGNLLYHGMKTTDGGMTWSFMGPASSDYYCIYFKDSKTGFETDAANGLIKTGNGGATWNNVSLPTGVFLERVVFTDNKTIVGVGSYTSGDGAILKSTDTGATWTSISNSLHGGGFYTISFPDPQNGFIAGRSDLASVIYNTTDSGNTWSVMSVPAVSSYFSSIYFVNKRVGYCVGSSGVILKYTAPTGIKDPRSNTNLLFYPNPTTKFINWDKNISGNRVSVSLYSIDGRLIKTQSFKDGVMDVSTVTQGIYILRCGNDAQLIQKE